MSMNARRILFYSFLVLGAVALVLMIANWSAVATWFLKFTGADDSSSTWYGFWSGFGGSIPDFLILGSIITVYRHHNCHVAGCLRLGKQVDGTPYLACPIHHPAHDGEHRSVSQEVINLAHRKHVESQAATATTPSNDIK
jgi:hypothetical protein